MKNFNSLYKATALGVAMVFGTSVLVMNGCKNPAQDIKVAIATESLSKSATLIRFVKANPTAGAALPATITVTIGGPGKDFVQTDNGGKDFVASNGLLPISLNRFSNPTVASPVVFTISANVTGYAPIFQKFTITSADDINNVVIPLLSYANPADGTAVSQTDKPLTGGASVAETKIETAVTATTPQTVELAIPAGTQVLDANKQVIAATSLKTTMVYYGTTDVDALDAVAPMLTAVNPIGPNNQPITGEVSFITAGAVSIDMTAGSTAVKNFSKSITAEIEINPALINPTTALAVKAGDVIPVWSLDESTGQWKYEGTTTVSNTGGKLVALININHLSTWALNWYTSTECSGSVNISLGADEDTYVGYQIVIASASGQVLAELAPDLSRVRRVVGAGSARAFSLLRRGRLLPGKIIVYSRRGDRSSKVLETAVGGCTDVAITIPAPAFTDFVDTDIIFVAKCTNKNIIAYPTTWMTLKDATDNSSSDVEMVNGKLSLKLKNGHTYSISAVYDEKTYTSEAIKIDRTQSISVSNAAGLKVTGSYNAGSKIMNLDAEFVVTDCK
ncbi:hypothetical protein [Pedobacter psychroterrae]|uniref:Uncharacterized protein n=1 Tax=Pedobacter psychroterrae TaxID=2530453 RepID=A0A4R0NTG2_9SPHI|nr:hypothetical protein [Pedobacter psychroterrae]TCD02735.1 hypothetical protein EZ437_01730 [Pedobacter psychroterrae]